MHFLVQLAQVKAKTIKYFSLFSIIFKFLCQSKLIKEGGGLTKVKKKKKKKSHGYIYRHIIKAHIRRRRCGLSSSNR